MITKRPATRLCLGIFCLLPSAAIADVFSIVIIPDTQMYVESNPEIFEAQVQWIIDHQLDTDKNIVYVAHLGDIKDDLSCDTKTVLFGGIPRTEWQIVRQVFSMLDTATSVGFPDGIPYGLLPGNHDFEPVSGQCPHFNIDIVPRPLVAFNLNFGPDSFNKLTGPPGIKRDYYGGNRVLGSNDDNYTLFSAAGIDFVAINLGYRGDANAISDGGEMAWADARLKEFSSRIGIITSHDVLSCNNSGESACDPFPNNFGNWAAQLYTVVANNKNLMMMTGAHKWGESWRVEDRSLAGNAPVQVLMSDYQRMVYPPGNPALPATFSNIGQTSFGDTGFMRMMTFDTITGIVTTTTFSPASVAALAGRPATVTDLVSSYFPYQALLSDGVISGAEMTTINAGTQMNPETASNIRFSFLGYTDTFYEDDDADTFGDPLSTPVSDTSLPAGYAANNLDCDDTNASINPAAPETANRIDDNCDGEVDEDFRYVFVSSSTHNGNLGGVAGADAICQGLADGSDLPTGSYKAWISEWESPSYPVNRLTLTSLPYVRPDGVQVTADWWGLWRDDHDAAIDVTETGGSATVDSTFGATVWATTNSDGINWNGEINVNLWSCLNWTSASPTDEGASGLFDQTDSTLWSNGLTDVPCDRLRHLYCLQE
jgi:hypothetical protein